MEKANSTNEFQYFNRRMNGFTTKQLIKLSPEAQKMENVFSELKAEGLKEDAVNVTNRAIKNGVPPDYLNSCLDYVDENINTACDTCDLCDSEPPLREKRLRDTCDSLRLLEENEILKLLKQARKILNPSTEISEKYPIDSLGVLAPAARTLATHGQVAPEIAGQCILGTAALLAQSRANVKTLAGIKPLSLYLLTIADSGEGKSTADDAAQYRIVEKQREAARDYINELKASEAEKGRNREVIREPYHIMRDGTVEGIRRSFRQGLPSQGVFSSEAAMMIAGYGMSQDNRAKSAGNLNTMWDSGEISVARGTDGRVQLYDRRLSLHWLVQPDVAFTVTHDPMLSNIGFWPRFLIAIPPPSKPLIAKTFTPSDYPEITRFWAACDKILAEPMGDDCSGLPVIEPTIEAHKLACKFYEAMQVEAKTDGGMLTEIKPFAVRATEKAFRIAGVLAAFSEQTEIDAEIMKCGLKLAGYSIETWRGVFGNRDEQAARNMALKLYEWMLKQHGQTTGITEILHRGPNQLRSRDKRDIAVSVLNQAKLVEQHGKALYAVNEVTE